VSALTVSPVIPAPKRTTIAADHPILVGDMPAVVFCGRTELLGELPGEPTAHVLHKLALPDPRLSEHEDFASTGGCALPRWTPRPVAPIDGVCFVFAESDHPDLAELRERGAVEDEHFVIAGDLPSLDDARTNARIEGFLAQLDGGPVVVLGYGHQGSALARLLRSRAPLIDVLVHDAHADSRAQAIADEFNVVDANHVLDAASAVIYSPLMRHPRLFEILVEARRRGLAVFDNTKRSTQPPHFVRHGRILLDQGANRALAVDGDCVRLKSSRLPYALCALRLEHRMVNGVETPNLQTDATRLLESIDHEINLAEPSPWCGLSESTRPSLRRAYLSLRNRADLGFFAARDLCGELWPEATNDAFPSEHVADLGRTAFERLLKGHLDGREVGSTMQTPSQRVALGVAARHYANDRPIVEIGSAFGGSAMLMAAATSASPCDLYSIDPETSTRDIMRFAFEREGFQHRLHQVIEPSDRAIHRLASLQGQAGLVFIDGLHTYAGVASDFELYAPLVAPGGALVFHDVCPAIYSVFRLVTERVLTDARFEIRCLVDGLAIFERRAEAASR
jgi:predicted O-methyltransferase YrrM